jgi:hypothetical protein
MTNINFENVEKNCSIHIWNGPAHILVSFEDTKTLHYYKTVHDVVTWLNLDGYKETARKFNEQYKNKGE